jgi:hypothetical protein
MDLPDDWYQVTQTPPIEPVKQTKVQDKPVRRVTDQPESKDDWIPMLEEELMKPVAADLVPSRPQAPEPRLESPAPVKAPPPADVSLDSAWVEALTSVAPAPGPAAAPAAHPAPAPETSVPVQLPLVPPPESQPMATVAAKPLSAPTLPVQPSAGARPAKPKSVPETAGSSSWLAAMELRRWWLPLGCGVAGILLTILWYEGIHGLNRRLGAAEAQLRAAQAQAAQFEKQAEDSEMKLQNVQTGLSQMNKLFTELKTPPPQPQFLRLPTGVLVFWIDGMIWRRYHFYQAKGTKKTLQRVTKRSTQRNFMYLPELEPGVWRFGVTALDREGNETALSEILEVKIQP